MDCTGCGRENVEAARFCAECGAQLAPRCVGCGEPVPPDAKFCVRCGTKVEDLPAGAPTDYGSLVVAQRKTITVVFGDVGGSTGLGERLDPEAARSVMRQYHTDVSEVVDANGGVIDKFNGDGFMATFGIPEVAEDDAARAVAAAVEIQHRFVAFADGVEARFGGDRITLRVGVNTGEIVMAEDDRDIVGDALNVAARLERACPAGRVLVGEATWRLTRQAWSFEPQGEVTVAGRVEPVEVFLVREAALDDTEAVTPFVGRDREVATVRDAFDDAVSARGARLVTIVGSPGLGKTRLASEAVAALGAGHVYTVACERAGSSTFAPVIDLVRLALGVGAGSGPDGVAEAVREFVAAQASDADQHRRVEDALVGVLGAGPARSTEEVFWAVRWVLESVARVTSVVLVVDDIQWTARVVLDLLEHLVEWVTDAPLLLVCLARPEIRDLRPTLAEPGRRAGQVIALEGLDAAATAELAGGMLGSDALPQALLGRLPTSTEGNPLFVRELVKMLVDDGVIRRTASGWELTIDVDAVEVPPTIASLLAARIDRLGDQERLVLERASVIGAEFPEGALRSLVEGLPGGLAALLERLRRMELVEPTGSYWGDEPLYRFHHVLIRDAAYRRLLKGNRADLHERVAAWMQEAAERRGVEQDETIAFHEEQVFGYRGELGPLDEDTRELGRHAAGRLHAAAQRALARDDLAAAASLATRALACIGDGPVARAELLLVACEALLGSGDIHTGEDLVHELDALATDDRVRAWAVCFRAQLSELTDPERLVDAEQEATRAAGVLAALGDASGAAKGHLTRAGILQGLGRVGDAEAELDLALTAGRDAGDSRRITAVLGAAPLAAVLGPSPVTRAGGRCLDVVRLLRVTTRAPSVEATSMRAQALLEALRGRFDVARSMIGRARRKVDELGLRHGSLQNALFAGTIEWLAGDLDAAEPALRDAYRGLAAMGLGAEAGLAAALLGRVLVAGGDLEQAEEMIESAEQMAGRNLKAATAWRVARAELLLARGDGPGARQVAESAVEILEDTDLVIDHAEAWLALARARSASGDAEGATAAESRARELATAKGATVIAPAPAAPATAGPDRLRPPPRRREPHQPEGRELWDLDQTVVGVVRLNASGWVNDRHPEFEVIDHRPGLQWSSPELVMDRAGYRDSTVAILGQRAALVHWSLEHKYSEHTEETEEVDEFFETSGLSVLSVDSFGRVRWVDRYEVEQVEEAIDKLWERYHEHCVEDGVEPVDNLAARGQVRSAVYFNLGQPNRATDRVSPEYVTVDHRPGEPDLDLGGLQRLMLGSEGWTAMPKPIETAGDHCALIVARLSAPAEDGVEPFYYEQLSVVSVGSDGHVLRADAYRLEQHDEARAELHRRTSSAPVWNPFDNLVVRSLAKGKELRRSADFAVFDHRSLVGAGAEGADEFAAEVSRARSAGYRNRSELVASLGEHTALHRTQWTTDTDFETVFLIVRRCDDEGTLLCHDRFDLDDLDAALDLLWQHYHEDCAARGEDPLDNRAAQVTVRSCALENLGRVEEADYRAPGYVQADRRPLTIEADPDVHFSDAAPHRKAGWKVFTQPIATLGERRVLRSVLHAAPADDGVDPFTVPVVVVSEVDESGAVTRDIQFVPEQLDEALTELRRGSTAVEPWDPEATPVVRLLRRSADAINTADHDGFERMLAAGAEFHDHRSMFRLTGGPEAFITAARGMHLVRERLLLVGSDRVALERHRFERDEFHIDYLTVMVVDAEGLASAAHFFDVEQLDDAVGEYLALSNGLGSLLNDAIATSSRVTARVSLGDVDGAMAVFADDYEERAHRRLVGSTDAVDLSVLRSSLADSHRDGRIGLARYVRSIGDRLALAVGCVLYPNGFRTDLIAVVESDGHGRLRARTFYDLDQYEDANADMERRAAELQP